MTLQGVEAPMINEIIIQQGTAFVPQLDGSYKLVLVNIVPITDRENRWGYWDAPRDSVFVDFNSRKVEVNNGWVTPCNSTMWHELKHAELDEQNIDLFDEHLWIAMKYKCS